MKAYSYDGFAEGQKSYNTLVKLIFLSMITIITLVGMCTGYPQAICVVIVYPIVNAAFSKKMLPCKIDVRLNDTNICISYRNINRDGKTVDEIYEFSVRSIRRIYWLKKKKQIGVCGYPQMTILENGNIISKRDCRKERQRKRIYIQYPYGELDFKTDIIVR